ncbi:MAG: ABC transporter ATP-binding protein [Deltaproteobacteria bacterium CG_4_8_14_3_um_filter_45_9]|nr:MAG: ABC transporter ATP-binding protein [Deltaproteobacteria bacterium CG03_land_8_20_14_0_80_45_14]PIX24060.1 MAG: ABC transporter ATP-binding protein [Deltaproteobacteria bacterium CG_4_8_14_3_um_filter_45_9]
MLEVEGIHTFYGLSHILFGVSLRVELQEVVCLLGRNGAGKTTTMKSVIGITPPKQGIIRYKGEEITGKAPYLLARKGISYIPDDRRIFADLTVGENLEIAIREAKAGGGWNKERVYELFPALKNIGSRKGGCLSGGEQKMLAIARALMGNPEFILLDEPFEGLAPILVHALEGQIRKLREAGLTVLIAEQNVRSTLRISDRGYIIDNGQIRYHGSIEDLRDNEDIRKKYLLV